MDRRLTSNSIIKRLLRKVARLIWRVEDLIVEYGKVQSKAETDRMSRGKIGRSHFSCCFVCLQ